MRFGTSIALAVTALVLASCGGGGDGGVAFIGGPGGGDGGGDGPPPAAMNWVTGSSPLSAALAAPGSVSTADGGQTITLVGGDGETACAGAQYGFATSPCMVTASLAGSPGTYVFDWEFTTQDASGPGADIFGVIVDGQPLALSDPGGAVTQSGHREVPVPQGEITLFVNCTDCTDGAANVKVSAFHPK